MDSFFIRLRGAHQLEWMGKRRRESESEREGDKDRARERSKSGKQLERKPEGEVRKRQILFDILRSATKIQHSGRYKAVRIFRKRKKSDFEISATATVSLPMCLGNFSAFRQLGRRKINRGNVQ